jgi:hypothetical protein
LFFGYKKIDAGCATIAFPVEVDDTGEKRERALIRYASPLNPLCIAASILPICRRAIRIKYLDKSQSAFIAASILPEYIVTERFA